MGLVSWKAAQLEVPKDISQGLHCLKATPRCVGTQGSGSTAVLCIATGVSAGLGHSNKDLAQRKV